MSERKTISVDPTLFTFKGGNNTSRKKKTSGEPKDLKIKHAPKQPHPKTLKNRLLHYIRKNQEQNFKKMHGENSEISVPEKSSISHITDTFNSDFEESMKYMNSLANEVSQKVDNEYMINRTLRNYKAMNPESILSGGGDFKQNQYMPSNDPVFTNIPESENNTPIKLSAPQWGCMKGGTLPTYKTWLHQTQKNKPPLYSQVPVPAPVPAQHPKISLNDMSISSISSMGYGGSTPEISKPVNHIPGRSSIKEESPIMDSSKLSQIKQTMDKIKEENNIQNNKLKYGKRKRTVRRTYTLGKSRSTPKVSVLISNKTVRKNISTKTEKLKHTPIEEIRTILIKKGFIKVGSLATNDVLRKMYESMVLVCGEVENHNPDNLLYNYFNS